MKIYAILKRIGDFAISLLLLFLLSPFFIIISLLIKLDSRGNIFIKQRRIGKNKREFMMFKFRTMRIDTPMDIPTHLFKNPDAYITRVGKILRKTSLDEIPQILNILRSEMSFVGPRPALWNQFDLISERDNYGANDVLPGITGWAQVNGRDELPIEIKAKYDGEYVEKMSLWLDIKVLWMTFYVVVTGKGVIEGEQNKGAYQCNTDKLEM